MTITLEDVRGAIRDMPRPVPPRTSPPEVLAIGDGISTTFFLGSPTALPAPYPLIVTFGTIVAKRMQHVEQSPTGANPWTLQGGQYGPPAIVFTTPPAADVVVGARYFRAMFTDAQLQRYIDLCEDRGSDRLTLKGIMCDIIPVILMDDDKLRVYTLGDTKVDPQQVRTALSDMLTRLTAEIQNPSAYSSPDIALGFGCSDPYLRY